MYSAVAAAWVSLWACVFVGALSAIVCMWRPDDLWESVLCPSHLGPKDETQGAQLEGQGLLQWSHLTSSSILFFR